MTHFLYHLYRLEIQHKMPNKKREIPETFLSEKIL